MKQITKTISIFLAILLLCCSCGNKGLKIKHERPIESAEEITEAHTTVPITTEPQTAAPETEPPVTNAAVTSAPETDEPTFPPQIAESLISKAAENTKSKNVFVYSVTNGTLLGYKASDERIVPASITKLLTALYALSVAPSDYVITVNKNDLALIKKGSAVAGIKAGYQMTVEQLVASMLLPSGNDAAYALAGGITRYLSGDDDFSGKEAVDFFMNCLNEYAKEIGCTSTVFTVPDGYAYTDHYTDIHDLIIIGTLALENEYISTHTKISSETLTLISGERFTLNNTNPFLNKNNSYYSPFVTGLKTGSLSNNYSIYLSAEIDGETFLIGVLGSTTKNGRYSDASKLIEAIEEYKKSGGIA